ncbi:flavin-containing monooxygenase [Gloeothece verrucosa]|uniref:4-hydroxybenzoate brominase (decarboxylating) n=1 Tax=Gloeothece verrucosa (strain PCC 7822) TaxID=497965 RepID=E0U9M0_GLOV7|nr:NAD(P)-binding domain-containing protein [Gloeothece verrucosa]ADN13821.1 flavin-containing monooxygenase FMO [Gloeothece verrucosa PCC 7822]
MNTTDKYLIIGAGFVGLGMAQALKTAGMAYDHIDASDHIGGNWYHGVYDSAHIISSKKVTQFTYFPMPAHYPDFPSAQQMRDYLTSFAAHFDLPSSIELNRTVTYVRPVDNNLWEVTFADGEQRLYKGVLMCNGHHWCKRFPSFEGKFTGEMIHSKDYKHRSQLEDKRVLVVGGGNSACDLAAEAARVGKKSVISMRESVWFLPKTFAGVPITDLMQWWMPEWLQRLIAYGIIRLSFGKHSDYGMSVPQHQIFRKHPTLNNEVPYYIKHGRIRVKPAIKRLDGTEVTFTDGSCEQFDLIVCATGYHLAYPFLPKELQRVQGAIVQCYGGSFLADYKGLYYIGWGQPRGGVGSLMSASVPILVRFLKLQDEINIPVGLVLKEMGQQLPQTHLSDPQEIFRRLKLTKIFFNQIIKKANQVDAQYPHFSNPILPPLLSEKTSSLVMF